MIQVCLSLKSFNIGSSSAFSMLSAIIEALRDLTLQPSPYKVDLLCLPADTCRFDHHQRGFAEVFGHGRCFLSSLSALKAYR